MDDEIFAVIDEDFDSIVILKPAYILVFWNNMLAEDNLKLYRCDCYIIVMVYK